ncbi:related to kinase-related protein [Phialocephala subalpina]|uniref:Related to kinase-related protein n=1 Tax=Phialocephala subalpina TaxID=576137 RepID=A0A1L7X3X6_9HELO|nr:related to kinase-related protein [Phialocephala subalpina]
MEKQINYLVEKTWAKFQTLPSNERLLIAISGIPGSGKTTLAQTVTTRLNSLHTKTTNSTTPIATMIPMDGYHLTRAQLAAIPNSDEAIFRRGAAFTFDADSYLKLVKKLRAPLILSDESDPDVGIVYAPSFDHALKDPIENDIPVPPTSRILLIEGLYLSLGSSNLPKPKFDTPSEAWAQAGNLMDSHWFISVPLETAGERLVKRHLASGICESEEWARKRVWESDLRNGREILEGRREFRAGVDEEVESVEDGGWRCGDR